MKTVRQMAAEFVKDYQYQVVKNAVRKFAKQVTCSQAKFEATTLKPKDGSSVAVAEHTGKVEVVFEYGGQRLRLLGDKDGIHVGTLQAAG